MLSATALVSERTISSIGLPSHLLCGHLALTDFRCTCDYYPPPASACARHPFYVTTCVAATAACGPGAKVDLAYTTGPFSVPHCPAGTSRTTGALILYGAVWTAVTEPPGLIAEVRLHQVLAIFGEFAATWTGTCPALPSATSAAARCEPIPVFPLLPGLPTCPAWPSAASAPARCEPFSANRLTPSSRDSGSGPGAMAEGAQEQAASCDAFVLSRRLPAPGAPPSRTSPACLVAKAPSNSRRTTARSRSRGGEFRHARSRTPLPDSVLAGGSMTDGVWQGGSVMSTPRRGPCRASRHDRP